MNASIMYVTSFDYDKNFFIPEYWPEACHSRNFSFDLCLFLKNVLFVSPVCYYEWDLGRSLRQKNKVGIDRMEAPLLSMA